MNSLTFDRVDKRYKAMIVYGFIGMVASTPVVVVGMMTAGFASDLASAIGLIPVAFMGLAIMAAAFWQNKVRKEGNTYGWSIGTDGISMWKVPISEKGSWTFQIETDKKTYQF